MTVNRLFALACAALLVFAYPGDLTARASDSQAKPSAAASAAANASPDLTAALSKEIGATPEQSAGAAGALFGIAKSHLQAAEFAQIAKAVPGMSALLKAAPHTGGKSSSPLSQLAGSAGALGAAAAAFSNLGLSPDLVAKAIPVLTSFVTKSGGANLGNLLAGALK
jgi:uncharacterized protein VcgC/VcgE DUF2780